MDAQKFLEDNGIGPNSQVKYHQLTYLMERYAHQRVNHFIDNKFKNDLNINQGK